MKKTGKTLLTAALLSAAAMGLSGCTEPVSPESEEQQMVYGPPPASDSSEYDPASEDVQTEYEAPYIDDTDSADEYDPRSENGEKVYGPPPDELQDSFEQ